MMEMCERVQPVVKAFLIGLGWFLVRCVVQVYMRCDGMDRMKFDN